MSAWVNVLIVWTALCVTFLGASVAADIVAERRR